MKTLELKNKKLLKHITEKQKISKLAMSIEDDFKKEQTKFDDCAKNYEEEIKKHINHINKIDTKAKPLLTKVWEKIKSDKYEELQKAYIKNGKLYLDILTPEGVMEEYKKRIDNKENLNNKQ